MATIFEYNGETLFEDKEDEHTIEGIQAHYASFFGELTQATYTVIPAKGEEPRKVIFAKTVGTKGGGGPTRDDIHQEMLQRVRLMPYRVVSSVVLLQALEIDSSPENLIRLGPEIERAAVDASRIARDAQEILLQCLHLISIPSQQPPHGF